MNDKQLLAMAAQARKNAHAPYSGYRVGACLLASSGAVYTGCNVESAAYPAGLCAERGALAGAIAAGERHFAALAVVSDGDHPTVPCGVCRQLLMEFGPDLRVLCAGRAGDDILETTLGALLPHAFTGDTMGSEQHARK